MDFACHTPPSCHFVDRFFMYRSNVCIVITNKKQNKVLMFHRIGAQKKGWQFPQGGVEPGESENDAFARELKEEIGTNRVKLLRVSEKRVKYKFPQWVLKEWKNRKGDEITPYQGQKQRWYLVRLQEGTDSIAFDEQPAEFDAFEWVATAKAIKRIVPFKRNAYKKGLKLLGMLN